MANLFEKVIKALSGVFGGKQPKPQTTIYPDEPLVEEIHSLWDYLKIREHTQTYHILSVVGYEEWVAMDEILRRVTELYSVAYKNERSLYPYIKTLVDCGLLETTNFSGKQRWRKKDLIVKIPRKKPRKTPEEETEEAIAEARRAKSKGGF